MKYRLPILTLAFALAASGWVAKRGWRKDATSAPAKSDSRKSSIPLDQQNAHQARDLLNQAIQALGGQAYLSVHDMQEQGRVYSFYGRPSSNGVFFWRFVEFPDKERIELTPQRDIAYIYTGNKGYEITYKGAKPVEQKDLDDYLRRKRFSLETVLRTWINDPKVALFFEGAALAGNLAAQKGNADQFQERSGEHLLRHRYPSADQEELFLARSRGPEKRTSKKKPTMDIGSVQGVMTPFGFTRYFNGDMQTERFITAAAATVETLDPAMFDPNSRYNPLKAAGKHRK